MSINSFIESLFLFKHLTLKIIILNFLRAFYIVYVYVFLAIIYCIDVIAIRFQPFLQFGKNYSLLTIGGGQNNPFFSPQHNV